MKIITESKVHVVGKQYVDEQELENFLLDHEVSGWETDTLCGGEKLSEVAGRVCYMSFAKPRPGGNAAYLGHIKEVGHGSVLEHAVWNLLITGVSRSLTHELVRHRAGFGYSQLSQRYVDESVCEVVVPEALKEEVALAEDVNAWTQGYMETSGESQAEADRAYFENHPATDGAALEAGLRWLRMMKETSDNYKILTEYLDKKARKVKHKEKEKWYSDRGYPSHVPEEEFNRSLTGEEKTAIRKEARQAARSVLPNATETKIFVTANARAIRHFIEMRGSKHAEPEIRMLAYKIWQSLQVDAHNLFGDYVWEMKEGKTPLDVTTKFAKV